MKRKERARMAFDTEERMLNEACADARTKGEYATLFSCMFRKVEIEERA